MDNVQTALWIVVMLVVLAILFDFMTRLTRLPQWFQRAYSSRGKRFCLLPSSM